MAIMAITTSNSISVNPRGRPAWRFGELAATTCEVFALYFIFDR